MSYFTSGVFWFIEGILFCVVLSGFKAWTIEHGIKMSAWKWVMVAGWILLAGFTIAFIGTSLGESEKTAALVGGSSFGVISILTGFVLWRVLGLGKRRS
ncbi:MAG: hypothetical protein KOO63_08420 [Bacteroidales bacterium]|nr:hypothetical protein [Candidatus Latescibacterota bacterium]